MADLRFASRVNCAFCFFLVRAASACWKAAALPDVMRRSLSFGDTASHLFSATGSPCPRFGPSGRGLAAEAGGPFHLLSIA